MASQNSRIEWPEGRGFAFTIFDDPDAQKYETTRLVYSFLADLGFRTTIAVWPAAPSFAINSGGETCANPEYRNFLTDLQKIGFEIAFHNAAPHANTRAQTIEGLDLFQRYFGSPPSAMANHYNEEAIYWGSGRLTNWRRTAYNLITRWQNQGKFFGHIEGHPMFWGDVCRERIRYCRNFVYSDINTLRACPWMPYSDPLRPYVRYWFAATEGDMAPALVKALEDRRQDQLEEQGGACVMYTHFGHGYAQKGRLNPEFRRVMERMAAKNGWFVPVSALLDFLMKTRGATVLNDSQRRRLEIRWLWEKVFRGTS
ncbi:MAG: hypothetical protein WB992_20605 [Bryobacteraceae bacterium]